MSHQRRLASPSGRDVLPSDGSVVTGITGLTSVSAKRPSPAFGSTAPRSVGGASAAGGSAAKSRTARERAAATLPVSVLRRLPAHGAQLRDTPPSRVRPPGSAGTADSHARPQQNMFLATLSDGPGSVRSSGGKISGGGGLLPEIHTTPRSARKPLEDFPQPRPGTAPDFGRIGWRDNVASPPDGSYRGPLSLTTPQRPPPRGGGSNVSPRTLALRAATSAATSAASIPQQGLPSSGSGSGSGTNGRESPTPLGLATAMGRTHPAVTPLTLRTPSGQVRHVTLTASTPNGDGGWGSATAGGLGHSRTWERTFCPPLTVSPAQSPRPAAGAGAPGSPGNPRDKAGSGEEKPKILRRAQDAAEKVR